MMFLLGIALYFFMVDAGIYKRNITDNKYYDKLQIRLYYVINLTKDELK